MTDRRLHEAFIKEMGRQASDAVTSAITKLEKIAPATGDRRFELLLDELRRTRQRVQDTAAWIRPKEAD